MAPENGDHIVLRYAACLLVVQLYNEARKRVPDVPKILDCRVSIDTLALQTVLNAEVRADLRRAHLLVGAFGLRQLTELLDELCRI